MNHPKTPLVVKPTVEFMETLLKDMEQGMLRIPKFQRPFVWKPEDMLTLFDSIDQGYPIGSLLIWKPDGSYESLSKIGPMDIPGAPNDRTQYILDGQQRLSTLLGVLKLPTEQELAKDDWHWHIFYDLKAQDFFQAKKPADIKDFWFPLNALLKTTDFLKAARKLEQQCKKAPGHDYETLLEEAEKLAFCIKNYKIAINFIEQGSIDDAVAIFSRLNTKGQKMARDQMISALTYKEGQPSLSQGLDDIEQVLDEYSFASTKRSTLYRAVLEAADLPIYNHEQSTITKQLEQHVNQYIDSAKSALLGAVKFLRLDIKLSSERLLPFTQQLLLLSAFFRQCPNPSESQKRFLQQWFWASSLSGWFSGMSTTKVSHALKELKDYAKDENTPRDINNLQDMEPRPLPTNFNMNSSRIRCLVILLSDRPPLDGAQQSHSINSLLGNNGSPPYIFIDSDLDKTLRGHVANRILLPTGQGKSAKEQLLQLKDLAPEKRQIILDSHAISPEAFQALLEDKAQQFLQLRLNRLKQLESDFFNKVGIPAPPEADFDHEEALDDAD